MRLCGPGIMGWPADRDNALRVLRRAVELGVNLVDTAYSYGPEVNELQVAEALHPYPDGLVIATKGGVVRNESGAWLRDGRPEAVRAHCEGSLRRLRLERIDLWQLHGPDRDVPIEETAGELARLRAEGKVRHVGLSNVGVELLERVRKIVPIVSVQNRYNLADRASDPVLEVCEQEQLAFLPWAPIQDHDSHSVVRDIAHRHGATVHQVVLAWLLARSPAMVPIPGTGSVAHLEENVEAAALELRADEVPSLTSSG
jgi:pyridoxine 4-dehydrogenase